MQSKGRGKRPKPKESPSRTKLTPEERAKVTHEPIERAHLEEVMRRLIATPPAKRKP